MAEQLFAIKSQDLLKLQRFYRKAPRQFTAASAETLSSFAFGTRRKSILVIKNRMTVRNERFVTGSLRVQKASRSVPMNSQVAIAGSISRARFSGWEEQELGTKTSRTRTATRFARKGGSRPVPPSLRMKPGNKFLAPRDFEGQSDEHKVQVMLQTLSRQRYKKPFVIKGHRRFNSGLYKFRGKKIMMIWRFKTRKQPKRLRWQTISRDLYFATTRIDSVWANSLRKVLRF